MKRSALLLVAGLSACGADDPEAGVGDAMPMLAWEGYVNETAEGLASAQPFVDYGSSDLAATGKRYALVHLSESF